MNTRGIPDLSISARCSEEWHSMPPAGAGRHCDACRKVVHDVAGMTPTQVTLLAMRAAAGDAVCGRLTRRGDGSLVVAEEPRSGGGMPGRIAVLSAAMAAGLPLAAQVADPSPAPAGHSAGAVVTGQLLHPDGTAVESGLVHLRSSSNDMLYVADDRGRFEMSVPAGMYDVVVQTGPEQAEHVAAVSLHDGYQTFGMLQTRAGQHVLVDEQSVMMGELILTEVSWSWKGRLRHPVLYVRSVARRLVR